MCSFIKGFFELVLFILNSALFLAGGAAAGLGCLSLLKIKDIDYFVIANLDTNFIDIVSIGVGGVLILVSFFGCFGVCRHSASVLKTYGGILAVLLLAEVGIGVLGYIYKDQIEENIEDGMFHTLKEYRLKQIDTMTLTGSIDPTTNGSKIDVNVSIPWSDHSKVEPLVKAWDNIQKDRECCGITGVNGTNGYKTRNEVMARTDRYKDWLYNATNWMKDHAGDVPNSCCHRPENLQGEVQPNCGSGADTSKINTKGCFDVVIELTKGKIDVLLLIGIGAAALQLFIVIVACCMAARYKREGQDEYRRVSYYDKDD